MGFFTRNLIQRAGRQLVQCEWKDRSKILLLQNNLWHHFSTLDKMGMYWCAQVCCSPGALSLCCDNEGKVSSKYKKFPSLCVLENYNRKHSTILLELSIELQKSRIQHLFYFYSENTKSLEDRTQDRTENRTEDRTEDFLTPSGWFDETSDYSWHVCLYISDPDFSCGRKDRRVNQR